MALAKDDRKDHRRPRARIPWGSPVPPVSGWEQQLADLRERLVEEKVKLQQARTVVGVLRLRINDLEQAARRAEQERMASGWEPPA